VFSISANWRYVGKVDNEDLSSNPYLATPTRYPASDEIKAQNYFDLALSADVTEAATFRVGVNNILDNDPPIIAGQALSGTIGNGNTYPGTWDSLGRYIFVGASVSF
jgi:outer membrane receptor protein involved in Fe transport